VSELPPGLEDFGARLEQVAEQDITQRREARRGRRWSPRSLGLPVAAAVVAAAASAGAVRVADRAGDPIKADPGGARRASLGAAALDPAVVVASAVPNPSGGPPWVLRVYTDRDGRDCVQVGRLRAGVFGQVQQNRFRALPASAPGTCGAAHARGPLVAVQRRPAVNLTLVYGLAIDRTPVTVRMGTLQRRVQPSGLGAFVTVFMGADRRANVVVRSRIGGRVDVQRFPGA
jgi:hypothetical protein